MRNRVIPVSEARKNLYRLVQDIAEGSPEVIIAGKHGAARLVSMEPAEEAVRPAIMKIAQRQIVRWAGVMEALA